MTRVVLASRSPQRLTLLTGLGLAVDVIESGISERTEGDPLEIVRDNAIAKALAVASRPDLSGAAVIAGDTEVILDGKALGQPADLAEARQMLRDLSGREHSVAGGLCVVFPGEEEPRVGVEETAVFFKEISDGLLDACLAGNEWKGRAGGYAIQASGSGLVERVEGDLSNVIGLPLGLLARLAPELLRSTRQN
jgi:septum formation protein